MQAGISMPAYRLTTAGRMAVRPYALSAASMAAITGRAWNRWLRRWPVYSKAMPAASRARRAARAVG